jgi:hypothetical protein
MDKIKVFHANEPARLESDFNQWTKANKLEITQISEIAQSECFDGSQGKWRITLTVLYRDRG